MNKCWTLLSLHGNNSRSPPQPEREEKIYNGKDRNSSFVKEKQVKKKLFIMALLVAYVNGWVQSLLSLATVLISRLEINFF